MLAKFTAAGAKRRAMATGIRHGTINDIYFFHAFAGGWFFSPETVTAVTKHGLATREQIEGWRSMLDEWKDTPGAISAIAWGQAIARKP